MGVSVCVPIGSTWCRLCVCVCVCVWKRERERAMRDSVSTMCMARLLQAGATSFRFTCTSVTGTRDIGRSTYLGRSLRELQVLST